jgi:hypothetical protein
MSILVRLFSIAALSLAPFLTLSQVNFNVFFEDKTFRFDFILGGNNETTFVYPQQMLEEAVWAGSKVNLTNGPDYGTYRFRVFDSASGELIFSRGFATLFQEWQTTAEAKTMNRAFYQAIHFPYPKMNFRLSIEYRNWQGEFDQVFSKDIDPNDYFIRKETAPAADITFLVNSGEPAKKIDLVFMSEGYAAEEREKFLKDAGAMTDYLFSVSPFDKNRDHFNVIALWTPSVESGTDIPGSNI